MSSSHSFARSEMPPSLVRLVSKARRLLVACYRAIVFTHSADEGALDSKRAVLSLSNELCLLILDELAIQPPAEKRKQYKVLYRVFKPFARLATLAFGKEAELERKRAVLPLFKAPQLVHHLTSFVVSFDMLSASPYYLSLALENVLGIISAAPLLGNLQLRTGIFQPDRLLTILRDKAHLTKLVLDCREIEIQYGDMAWWCALKLQGEAVVVHKATWGAGSLLEFLAPLSTLRSLSLISLQSDPTFLLPLNYRLRLESLSLTNSNPGSVAEILSLVGQDDPSGDAPTLTSLDLSLKSSFHLDNPHLDRDALRELFIRLGPNLQALSLSLPDCYIVSPSILEPLTSLRQLALAGSPLTSFDFLNSLPASLEAVTFLGRSLIVAFFLDKCLLHSHFPLLRFLRTGDGADTIYGWTEGQLRGMRGLREHLRETRGIEWAHMEDGKWWVDF